MIHQHDFFFFFQAEDGIRDYKVTGVQTCALPIWVSCQSRWIALSSEIPVSDDGAPICRYSLTVTALLATLSSPFRSTAVTKYRRCGTPLSWKVFEVVTPRRPNDPLRLALEYTL